MLYYIKKILRGGPFGLKKMGTGSVVHRPFLFQGRENISIGRNVVVLQNSWISTIESYKGNSYKPTLHIGDNVYIGRHSCIVSMNEVIIGDGCVLSEHVYIADNSHGLDPRGGLIMEQPLESKGPVRIGENSFIGYRAVLVPNVTLGHNCVVGANSVVTQSFPPYSMIAGCPARLIKKYDTATEKWLSVNQRG